MTVGNRNEFDATFPRHFLQYRYVRKDPAPGFLDFVLGQYVSQREGELEPEKLPGPLELKAALP